VYTGIEGESETSKIRKYEELQVRTSRTRSN
jgi:hypothetical protein